MNSVSDSQPPKCKLRMLYKNAEAQLSVGTEQLELNWLCTASIAPVQTSGTSCEGE